MQVQPTMMSNMWLSTYAVPNPLPCLLSRDLVPYDLHLISHFSKARRAAERRLGKGHPRRGASGKHDIILRTAGIRQCAAHIVRDMLYFDVVPGSLVTST